MIDLIVGSPDGAVIADFKTAARSSEPLEIFHEIQLTSYAYLFRQLSDQTEAGLEIRQLDQDQDAQGRVPRLPGPHGRPLPPAVRRDPGVSRCPGLRPVQLPAGVPLRDVRLRHGPLPRVVRLNPARSVRSAPPTPHTRLGAGGRRTESDGTRPSPPLSLRYQRPWQAVASKPNSDILGSHATAG